MKRFFPCILLLSLVISACSSTKYKMLDGNSAAVTFTSDSSVFNDPDFPHPSLFYSDMGHIGINTVSLEKNIPVSAIIHQPTFIGIYANTYLVYPGEKITIYKGKYNDFTFKAANASAGRNNELLFFWKFYESGNNLSYKTDLHAGIDSVLVYENELKKEIPFFLEASRKKFDSLSNVLDVSEKFRALTKNYFYNRYETRLQSFYEFYKDTLQAHGLFAEKYREILKLYNDIDDRDKLVPIYIMLELYADEVLPYKITKVETAGQFSSVFDSIESIFNGATRNYLMTQLIYRAFKRDIPVPEQYFSKFQLLCTDKEFLILVKNLKAQQKNKGTALLLDPDNLLMDDGKKTIGFRQLLAQNIGKVIYLDMWAHWCAPCREDMPDYKKLVAAYKGKEIAFIRLSIDREVQPWRKAVLSDKTNTGDNYLFINHIKAPFIIDNKVLTIPRYMIIDKKGNINISEAPGPGDSALKPILNKLMNE